MTMMLMNNSQKYKFLEKAIILLVPWCMITIAPTTSRLALAFVPTKTTTTTTRGVTLASFLTRKNSVTLTLYDPRQRQQQQQRHGSLRTTIWNCHEEKRETETETKTETDLKTSSQGTATATTSYYGSRRHWLEQAAAATAAGMTASTLSLDRCWAAEQDDGDNRNVNADSWILRQATSSSPPTPLLQGAVCDPSVSVWKRDNRLLYLLGTAHISEQSAQVAANLVYQVHPNAVFVELDLKRLSVAAAKGVDNSGARAQITPTRLILDPVKSSSPSRIVVPRVTAAATTTTTTQRSMLKSANVNPSPKAISSSSSSSSSSSTTTALTMTTSAAAAAAAAAASSDLGVAADMWSSQSNDNDDNGNDLISAVQQPPRGLFSVFRQRLLDLGASAVGNAIRGMYQDLDQAGFKPGEEFALAMKAGQQIGADIVLGDRDVQITLQRLTQALAVTDYKKLTAADSELEQSMKELMGQQQPQQQPQARVGDWLFSKKDSDPVAFKQELSQYVETIKSRDRVRTILAQLREAAPALVQVMLTERDAYMAAGIDMLDEYPIITAVMGVAHQDGVEQNLKQMNWQNIPVPCQTQQQQKQQQGAVVLAN